MGFDELWKFADKRRSGGLDFNLSEFLRATAESGMKFDVRDVSSLVRRHRASYGEFFIPESVVAFAAALLSGRKARTICDPCAGLGFLVIPVAEQCRGARAYAFERNNHAVEATKAIPTPAAIEWRAADSLHATSGGHPV